MKKGKKARDLSDVSTEEEERKKKSAEICYAKVTVIRLLLFRSSSVSLREDSRSEEEGKKEIISANTVRVSFVRFELNGIIHFVPSTLQSPYRV